MTQHIPNWLRVFAEWNVKLWRSVTAGVDRRLGTGDTQDCLVFNKTVNLFAYLSVGALAVAVMIYQIAR